MSAYRGPTEISHFTKPGRGTSYTADFEGHQVQVYITEKRKQIRMFVDGQEWTRDDATRIARGETP